MKRKFITARKIEYVTNIKSAHIEWCRAMSFNASLIGSISVECLGTYEDRDNGETKENWFVSLMTTDMDEYCPDVYFTVSPMFETESEALNAYNDFINMLNGSCDNDVVFAYQGFMNNEEDFV